jgi:hypothetical protein
MGEASHVDADRDERRDDGQENRNRCQRYATLLVSVLIHVAVSSRSF